MESRRLIWEMVRFRERDHVRDISGFSQNWEAMRDKETFKEVRQRVKEKDVWK